MSDKEQFKKQIIELQRKVWNELKEIKREKRRDKHVRRVKTKSL